MSDFFISERVLKELKSRFAHFMKTGDDSKIPADLQRVIFAVVCSNFKPILYANAHLSPSQAVRHGGTEEYDAVVQIYDKPRTPTSRVAAMSVYLLSAVK